MKKRVCLFLVLVFACIGMAPLRAGVQHLFQQIQQRSESGISESNETSAEINPEVPDSLPVRLYYRYGETRYLGTAEKTMDIRDEETIASYIVRNLIAGPDMGHSRLSGVFPEGTELISVVGEGSTVFVTLNRAFLGQPDGAPGDWEDSTQWQNEAALRRTLAFQSMVLSLTEEGQAQRVQLYIADSDDEVGQRLQLFWFDPEETDPQLYLGVCGRDESVCLNARNTLSLILSAWQQRDFLQIAEFLNRNSDSSVMPGDFAEEMEGYGTALLDFTLSDGVVSLDGSKATLVMDGQIQTGTGEIVPLIRETILLERDEENWAINQETLVRLMIRD